MNFRMSHNIALLLVFLHLATTALAQSPTTTAPAPAPAGPLNVTKVLEKAGQFTTFIRLLKITQVGDQINTQLNNSNSGMTLFVPTDNAFSSLSSGTLNSLSDQQKVALIQFHVLPTFISVSQFQTASNPLRTQAGDATNGQYPLNVTTSGNQLNLTTGVVNTTVANTIYSDNKLAVYQVDQVLLPLQLFGPPSPAPSPAPASSKPSKRGADATGGPSTDAADDSSANGLHEATKWFVIAAASSVLWLAL